MLKVGAENLPALPLGDSDRVRQGDRILTLGSPQGLEETASEGMVSAVRLVDKTLHLQITAPISHGNSGGPVLNMQGEAVGITVFYLKESQSLNFAVAINETKSALESAASASPLPGYVAPDPVAADAARLKRYSASRLFRLGNSAWSAGKPDEARRYWDAATVKDPKMLDAWLMAAQACSTDLDWKGAIDRLKVIIHRSPKHAAAHLLLGDAYRFLGGHDSQAVTAYGIAVRYCVGPIDKYRAYTGLARVEAKLGNFENAVHAYRSAMYAYGSDATLCFSTGFAYERLGRHDDAETMFVEGRKLIPDPTLAWTKLGNEWRDSYNDVFGLGDERWSSAASAYEEAIAFAAEHKHTAPVDAYYSLAETYEKLNRWPDVVTTYLTALKFGPHYGHTSSYLLKLGEAYLKVDDIESAKAQYGALRLMRPSHEEPITPDEEASILRYEIAAYGVPRGLVRVCGNLTVWLHLTSTQRAAVTKADVTVDGKRIEDVSFYALLDAMVDSKGEVVIEVNTNPLANAPHRLEVTMMNGTGAEVAHSALTVVVDNSRVDDVYTMKDFTAEVLVGPPLR